MILGSLGSGLLKLEISQDNRVFYSSKNEVFNNLLAFEDKYLPNHNVTFLVSQRNKDNDRRPFVDSVSWLAEESWAIENVIRVDSIDNYPIVSSTSDEEVELTTVKESICHNESEICSGFKELEDPRRELLGRLISRDGSSLAVSLTLELVQSDTGQIQRIVEDVASVKESFKEKYPQLDIHHTGGIPMMHAFAVAAEEDSTTLAPVTFLLILCLVWWFLGSAKATLFLIGAGVSSAVMVMGTAGHLGILLNPATSITSILVITLVVTAGMHYASSYLNDSQIYDNYRASVNTTSVNLRPILLTTLTSMAGLLSLVFADAPPIGQLGALAALGVFLGTLHIFILGPICLQRIPSMPSRSLSQLLALRASRISESRTRTLTIALMLAVVTTGVFNLSINDDFVRYFDERFEFRNETDFVSRELSGPNHLEIDINSGIEEGIFDSDYLADVRDLQSFLNDQPLVENTFSFVDVFEEIGEMFGLSPYSSTKEELAQFYLTFELSLREGQSTTDYVSSNRSSSRVSVVLGDSDSDSIGKLITAIEDWAEENMSTSIVVTGENAPVSNLTPTNFREMIIGIGMTLCVVSIVIGLALKSMKLAALCLACTVLPVVLGFGAWGWAIGEIGLASVVVIAITLGIVVDDAIHITTRYSEIAKSNSVEEHTARQTVRIVGPAIISSSASLACGFLVLTLSGFGINSTMGACTAIIVLAALFVDLVLLPLFLAPRPSNAN